MTFHNVPKNNVFEHRDSLGTAAAVLTVTLALLALSYLAYGYAYATQVQVAMFYYIIIIIINAGIAVFYVAGYLIEERRIWPVITASPTRTMF